MGRAILGMILSLLGIGGNLSSEVHAETVRYQDLTVTYEGQLIKITAQTNPSTGFDYKVKDYDATAVSVLPASYYMDEKDRELDGASSLGTYPVKILKPGNTSFIFSYLRDWEGGEVASTYRFDITADDRLNVTDISISDARAPAKKTFSYERLKISYGGDLVTINVKTNPSTGFDWYYKKTDDSSVKIMKPSYKSTSTDPTAAGAPSKGSYPLQILKEGQTSFYFSYMRNWKGGEIADTYRIDVTASAGPVIDRVEIVRVDELKDIPDLHE